MEEVEITAKDNETYEVVPLTPLRRLEERIKRIEMSTTLPQLQNLINQIIDLIRTNQKLVDDVLRANQELREELARIPDKIDGLTKSLNELIDMIKAAASSEEESITTNIQLPELREMVEMQKEILKTNKHMLEAIEELTQKIKPGTPVSHIITKYPNIKIRSVQTR